MRTVVLATMMVVLLTTAADAGRRGWDRGRDRGWDRGGEVIGEVIGGVLGVIIESQRPRYYPPPRRPIYSDAIEYCIQQFRSYDPETGFYRGYDGRLRRCP